MNKLDPKEEVIFNAARQFADAQKSAFALAMPDGLGYGEGTANAGVPLNSSSTHLLWTTIPPDSRPRRLWPRSKKPVSTFNKPRS